MRICIFSHPGAIHTRRMVAALRERGASIHIVYKGNHEPHGATYEPFAVPKLSLGTPIRRSVRRLRYLSKFFQEYDLVTVFYMSDWGFYDEAIACGRLALWPWGSDINPPPGAPEESASLHSRRLEMFRCSHGIAACSQWFAGQIANYAGVDQHKVSTVPLGVDLDLFKPAQQPIREPVVGFLKGFGPAYGAECLIKAMPEIVARVPKVRFELVGGGVGLQACRNLANELNVSSYIRWLSPQPHSEIPELLRGWRVSVIPSVVESFGVAALESSACGVPVVASNVGGLPETVIDGKTGILTAPGAHNTLAAGVVSLLSDMDQCTKMGRAGRAFVANRFEWRTCADRWMKFFEDTASKPKRQSAAMQRAQQHARV